MSNQRLKVLVGQALRSRSVSNRLTRNQKLEHSLVQMSGWTTLRLLTRQLKALFELRLDMLSVSFHHFEVEQK